MQTYIVMGLNRTGRAICFMLAAAAGESTRIILVDEDIVSKEALDEGFPKYELGAYKAEALHDVLEGEFPNVQVKSIRKPGGSELYDELQDLAFDAVMFCCKPLTAKTQQHIFKLFRPLCSDILIANFPTEPDGKGHVTASSSHFGDFPTGGVREIPSLAPGLATEMFIKAKYPCNQP